jgi:hypothetical protein
VDWPRVQLEEHVEAPRIVRPGERLGALDDLSAMLPLCP